MKALPKKKYTEAEAVAYIAGKYGLDAKDIKLKKEHRTRWMFSIQASGPGPQKEALELKPWPDFVKDFKDNNPGLKHAEALKAASPLYAALKGAADDKALLSSATTEPVAQEEKAQQLPANYPELIE